MGVGAGMAFLGMGSAELAVIAVVVVLLFGASQIPKLARSLGQARAEFGKARKEFDAEVAKGESGASAPADDEQVRKTAAGLGIATEGRSTAELKVLIQQKLA